MPSIADYRNKFPSLRELGDDDLISRVADVQGVDREDVIAHMGYKPPSISLWERTKRGVGSTLNSAQIAAAGPDDIAGLVAEEARNQLAPSAAARAMQADIKPYQEAYTESSGLSAVGAAASLAAKRLSQFVMNPREAAGMIAENLPNSAPGMAGMVAGGLAGAATPIPGGAIAGSLVGGTAGGYLIEQGSAMRDQILKEAHARGVDPKDAATLAPIIAEKYDEFLTAARLKGAGTAFTDAVLTRLTMGLGGIGERAIVKGADASAAALKAGTRSAAEGATDLAELTAKEAARNTLGAKLRRGAGMTVAEMGGEAMSEAVGQQLAYGKVDALDVIDEGLLAVGQGAAMAGTRGLYSKAVGATETNAADTALARLGAQVQARQTATIQQQQADIGMEDLRAATNADDAIDAALRATAVPLEVPPSGGMQAVAGPRAVNRTAIDEIRSLDPAQQQEALGLLATIESPRASPAVRRFAQNSLDAMLLPVRQLPVGEATEVAPLPVPDAQELPAGDAAMQAFQQRYAEPLPVGDATEVLPTPDAIEVAPIPVGEVSEGGPAPLPDGMAPRTQRAEPTPAVPPVGDADIVRAVVEGFRRTNTPQARAFVQDFTAGRITPADVLKLVGRQPASPDERLAAAAAQAPKKTDLQPGDILTVDGQPFGTRSGAYARSKKDGGSVIEVPGGWAVRPKESASVDQRNLAGTSVQPPAPRDGGGNPAARGIGAVGFAPPAPARVVPPAAAPDASGGPAAAVADGRGTDAALTDSRPAEGTIFDMDGRRWTVVAAGKRYVTVADSNGKETVISDSNEKWKRVKKALDQSAAKNAEPVTADPVAESLAPAPSEPGDGAVARARGGSDPQPAGAQIAAEKARELRDRAQSVLDDPQAVEWQKSRAREDIQKADALDEMGRGIAAATESRALDPSTRARDVPPSESAPAIDAKQLQKQLQKQMAADGWKAEVAGPGNTIWTRREAGERYTALLTPAAGAKPASMEITALVDAVDTQIDEFDVTAGDGASRASKAVADDLAENKARAQADEPATAPAPKAAVRAAPTPTPAPTKDPFVDGYSALEGKMIEQRITTDDGKTATMRMDAAVAMRDFDSRETTLEDLRLCLGRGS